MNETAKTKYQHNTEIDKDKARKTFPLIIFVVFFFVLIFCIDLDLDWIRYYLLNALFQYTGTINTYTHIFFSDYLLNYLICVIYGYKKLFVLYRVLFDSCYWNLTSDFPAQQSPRCLARKFLKTSVMAN